MIVCIELKLLGNFLKLYASKHIYVTHAGYAGK